MCVCYLMSLAAVPSRTAPSMCKLNSYCVSKKIGGYNLFLEILQHNIHRFKILKEFILSKVKTYEMFMLVSTLILTFFQYNFIGVL